MSPRRAAQCSAVIPSPCAALTSLPCFRSARTASLLPAIAASATVVSAAASTADKQSAAIALTQQPLTHFRNIQLLPNRLGLRPALQTNRSDHWPLATGHWPLAKRQSFRAAFRS